MLLTAFGAEPIPLIAVFSCSLTQTSRFKLWSVNLHIYDEWKDKSTDV